MLKEPIKSNQKADKRLPLCDRLIEKDRKQNVRPNQSGCDKKGEKKQEEERTE